MLYPIHSLNLNILKIMGRSDLFLKLEVYKKLLAIPTVLIGMLYGLKPMLSMILISSIISFFINSSNSGKLIGYSTKEQISDIAPSFLISILVATPVYIVGFIVPLKPILILILQVVITLSGALLVGKYSKYSGILEIRDILTTQINRLRRSKS